MWDMHDVLRCEPLSHAQPEIPVLTAVELLAKATDGAHQIGADRRQVAEEVLREDERRVPIGLEVVPDGCPGLVDDERVRVDVTD